MENFAPTALLIASLIVPAVLFWWLRTRSPLNGFVAAAVAIAAGWALNLAWAFVAGNDLPQGDMDTMSIATWFGWFCPTALVSITWLVLRIKSRRKA